MSSSCCSVPSRAASARFGVCRSLGGVVLHGGKHRSKKTQRADASAFSADVGPCVRECRVLRPRWVSSSLIGEQNWANGLSDPADPTPHPSPSETNRFLDSPCEPDVSVLWCRCPRRGQVLSSMWRIAFAVVSFVRVRTSGRFEVLLFVRPAGRRRGCTVCVHVESDRGTPPHHSAVRRPRRLHVPH